MNEHGYGRACVGGKVVGAHRVAYCEAKGLKLEGIKGWQVCHHCDVRNCVEPEHLFLGTNADNVADRVAKGRNAPWNGFIPPAPDNGGEKNPAAKLTEQQVLEIRAALQDGSTLAALAERFKVRFQTISAIKNRKIWKHL